MIELMDISLGLGSSISENILAEEMVAVKLSDDEEEIKNDESISDHGTTT